jgi:Icc protein
MVVKVVQLTDTHLFRTPEQTQKGVNTYESLKSVVSHVTANHSDLDAVLLTGDLSQDETPESYDRLKELLAPLGHVPMYAIPGNHDDLDHMHKRLAGDGICVLSDARLGTWRIAMLNSQVPGRVHGELGQEQIEGLSDSLRASGDHTIVAIHHPPVVVNSAWIDASRCLDGEELLAVTSNPPVKVVVCGHVHQVFESTRDGVAVLTTPSTCVQFEPDRDDFAIDDNAPGYRVFNLEQDGNWSTTVHRIEPSMETA